MCFHPLLQIIVYILSFLHASDRKEASLVCRSWYDASQDLRFQVTCSVHVHFYDKGFSPVQVISYYKMISDKGRLFNDLMRFK